MAARLLLVVLVAAAALGASGSAAGDASPVTIAVVDTGVDAVQPFLAQRLVPGYDALGDGATTDGEWHGTAIASIVAGLPDGSPSCAACLLMPVKALGASGVGTDEDIARGIVWAVDHGARVVNLSVVGLGESSSLRTALRYAQRHDVVVVAAAGNDGTAIPSYPAADPNAIAVAAAEAAPRLYPWSNRGRWVTVAAPGVNASVVPGGGIFSFAGTSSAAAVVSRVVGLCISEAPTLTPALVRRALVSAATPIPGARFGRVDAARTIELCRRYAGAA
jgi:thermitase